MTKGDVKKMNQAEHALPTSKANVILHAFDWKYADIAKQAKKIQELGYGSVLVSPPLRSAKSPKWWQRYQPQDYRVIDNALGNTTDFQNMVTELQHCGVWVYADVVFNHMANEAKQRADLNYPSKSVLEEYMCDPEYYESQRLFGDLSEPLFTEEDFVEAFGIRDWKDKWQVQNGRISGGPTDPGLPTLRVHEHVITQQRHYLMALKAMGVKGFRIDAAKHMTLEHIKQVWTEDITQGMHIFGEIITDGGATEEEYELFLQPYLQETRLGAYDFPLFSTLFKAFAPKGSFKSLIDPYCFGQALSNRRAITFVTTHDIPNNDVFANLVLDEENEWLAYAYVLGRDGGTPLIYTDLDTSGILNQSGQPRWKDAWHDPRMVQMIAFHNHFHSEPMTVLEGNDDMLVFSRGERGFVVINKSARKQTISLSLARPLQDMLTGKHFLPMNGKIEIVVAAKTALMMC
ncbi:alpha-amylase family glycosyl hydrolase [Vibrio vulnificus]|uniref:alpha-amylase family glycosyl hydrolase n=1 Tax=Vibrio vulnificus TaxID=672 RepID=UPI001EEA1616|nr:alpha-amylase family glycosyl hydrolase [Vibrio vulnificus]MCG6306246.1 alpha-amylase family glycosyl hydrolase [Vibrio vulnificus]MCU8558560.1 alpha-amylase family glycosyl hydrolase [Vibrio vulnificus]